MRVVVTYLNRHSGPGASWLTCSFPQHHCAQYTRVPFFFGCLWITAQEHETEGKRLIFLHRKKVVHAEKGSQGRKRATGTSKRESGLKKEWGTHTTERALNHCKEDALKWHAVQSYSCPQGTIKDVEVIEVEVILTGWVDTAPLDLSELLKITVMATWDSDRGLRRALTHSHKWEIWIFIW